ncbi:MAG: PCRF domain-containing protein [Phycisphaeraceae bacterium]|nr:MAG: PCRF domain-containing protein [Phycisphaeraceae bacterium]
MRPDAVSPAPGYPSRVSEILADMPPAVVARLDDLAARRDALAARLSDPEVLTDHRAVRDLSIKKAALDDTVDRYRRLQSLETEAAELREAVRGGDDPELAQLAREELPKLEAQARALAEALLESLVTADDRAIGSVILEIRAGVGGDEAALWAGDLLTMYQRLAEARGWSFEMMELHGSVSHAAGGGVKHAVINIAGEGAWSDLAHEAGVHCVKRVPATETQGRIHTSTATIAALPEPEEVDLKIDPADVTEHITTAQGPGGQNVNKVATAVHLIHEPTGVEVRMQESKSQRQNKEKAWRLLRARLYELEMEKQRAQRDQARSAQIGAAGRSERIRTYRYKENIAVDHRLNESFSLQSLLAGEMGDLMEALRRREVAERLERL